MRRSKKANKKKGAEEEEEEATQEKRKEEGGVNGQPTSLEGRLQPHPLFQESCVPGSGEESFVTLAPWATFRASREPL